MSFVNLLRWPFFSWNRLVGTLVVFFAVAAIISSVTTSNQPENSDASSERNTTMVGKTNEDGSSTSSGTSPDGTPASTPTFVTPTDTTEPSLDPSEQAPSATETFDSSAVAAQKIAERFVAAWTSPPDEKRDAELKKVATSRVVELVNKTPPPKTLKLSGDVKVAEVTDMEATVEAPMSDGKMAVLTLEADTSGWVVAEVRSRKR